MIIAFAVWSIIAVLFLAIGIWARSSKEAVGFFTGVKPPAVSDTVGYNRSVSKLWVIAAAVFEILGVPFLFLRQNSAVFAVVILGVVAWSIGIAIAYTRIEEKYKQ